MGENNEELLENTSAMLEAALKRSRVEQSHGIPKKPSDGREWVIHPEADLLFKNGYVVKGALSENTASKPVVMDVLDKNFSPNMGAYAAATVERMHLHHRSKVMNEPPIDSAWR